MSKAPPGIREVPFHSQKALLYMYPTVHLTHKQASRGKTNSLAPPFFSFLKHNRLWFLDATYMSITIKIPGYFSVFFFSEKKRETQILNNGSPFLRPHTFISPKEKEYAGAGGGLIKWDKIYLSLSRLRSPRDRLDFLLLDYFLSLLVLSGLLLALFLYVCVFYCDMWAMLWVARDYLLSYPIHTTL